MSSKIVLVLSAVVLSAAGRAAAEPSRLSLDETEAWAEVQKDVDTKAQRSSETCGSKISAKVDVGSFAGVDLDHSPVRAYGRDSVGSIETVCRTPAAKKAVQGAIKTVTIRRGKDGTRVALSNGDLVVFIDPDHTSIAGKKPGSYTWVSAIREVL